MSDSFEPAVWFPAIRAGSGTDVFTENLCRGLRAIGLRAEITWLPHRAEYAPHTVRKPEPPGWANVAHVNTWLPRRFLPDRLPILSTIHSCVHDPCLTAYKTAAQAFYHRYWIRPMERTVLQQSNRIVSVSRYTRHRAMQTFGRQAMTVIHNGIQVDSLGPIPKRKTPNHPFQMIYVGNWSSLKGVDLLPKIMARLGSDYALHCYGGTPRNTSVLPSNMYCHGRAADFTTLQSAYRNADALLFPSRLEGFGLVVAEAQATGLPVIATDGSALRETIEHETTGLLCPPDDVNAFIRAAVRLRTRPEHWARMANDAAKAVRQRADWNRFIARYVACYQRCLRA